MVADTKNFKQLIKELESITDSTIKIVKGWEDFHSFSQEEYDLLMDSYPKKLPCFEEVNQLLNEWLGILKRQKRKGMTKTDFEKISYENNELKGELCYYVEFYGKEGESQEWYVVPAYLVKNDIYNAVNYCSYVLNNNNYDVATVYLGYPVIDVMNGVGDMNVFQKWDLRNLEPICSERELYNMEKVKTKNIIEF